MVVSYSKIKAFKSCRRAYDLRYNEGLVPVKPAEAIETGSNYHKLLESMYKGDFDPFMEDEYSKENAMANAYYRYIYPKFKVTETEKKLEYDLGSGDKLIGFADAVAEDGYLVEHKTTSSDITEAYEYQLQWDEQILAYMLMTGMRKVHYTVCRKPTIRQKQDESDEEFWHRMVEWYDTDTDSKIRLLEIYRTDDEVAEYEKALRSIVLEMNIAENQKKHSAVLTDPYYKNTCQCNMYGRRCEYSSICLHYDPKENYMEFERRE